MLTELLPYNGLLPDNKWTSKIDFITRLKTSNDISDEYRLRCLRFLQHLHFSFIKKGMKGELLMQ